MDGGTRGVAKEAVIEGLAQGRRAGVTVITPNRRLALALAREVGDRHVAEGRTVWEAPDILPFGTFVERLWNEALFSERGASVPALLSEVQEQLLWEEILAASRLAKDLMSARAAARQCREAWALLHAWSLRGRIESAAAHDDARAFVAWMRDYEAATRERRCTDAARLPALVRPLASAGGLRLPQSLG